jgi:predicted transcriptional regulator
MSDAVKKRSHFGTIYNILKFCNPSTGEINILCRANLNLQRFERYLAVHLEHSLLEVDDNEFRTTEKGLLFTRKFEEFLGPMEGYRQHLDTSHTGASVTRVL